jgi:hypothetical protein
MIKRSHSDDTKKYFQSLMLFIDSTIMNLTNAENDKNKILMGSLLNIKDSLLSELVKDNHVVYVNKVLEENAKKVNNQKKPQDNIQKKIEKENLGLDQEIELEKDQKE